jgi:hypothetical protein
MPAGGADRPAGVKAAGGISRHAVERRAFVTKEMGLMRRMTSRGAGLLTAWLVLAATGAYAQLDYAPPDMVLPYPLYSTRPEDGGFFFGTEFVLYRQTNPLKGQIVAQRGFIDFDGALTGTPGTFVGSRFTALDVRQVSGPNGYMPGVKIDLGWRFHEGDTLTFSWMYLSETQRSASATLVPPTNQLDPLLANTFLTSPVFNFPPDYAGPAGQSGTNNLPRSDIAPGNGATPVTTYGIWNAATIMTESFVQRTQNWDLLYRKPIWETDCSRFSALLGAGFWWIWERYLWSTTDVDYFGVSAPTDRAVYSNILSNRMYGIHGGCNEECYLGHGFACYTEFQGGIYLDVAKERVLYELGQKHLPPQAKFAKTDYTVVPEIQGKIGLAWYPAEGIQFRIDYNLMAFFNTFDFQRPVNFDYGALGNTKYYNDVIRVFDGLQAGIALIF